MLLTWDISNSDTNEELDGHEDELKDDECNTDHTCNYTGSPFEQAYIDTASGRINRPK